MHSYLRGEGCGALVLVQSGKAEPGLVYANILATNVMSDGTSVSITAPNGAAQEELINRTVKKSGISASSVDYIEAHGTGTALGDPIEMEALAEVFACSRSQSNPLMVSSVKANIGHLEGAAGMAGLIKTVLVLGHVIVPPNAALRTLNPLIRKTVESKRFAVSFPTRPQPLKANCSGDKRCIAGVSSFGYSGTIAHAILEEAPDHIRRSVEDEEDAEPNADIDAVEASTAVFLFTGQGLQYDKLGKDLYKKNKVFRASMDRCNHIFKSMINDDSAPSLLDIIFCPADKDVLTVNTQTACISTEWSLAQMWLSKDMTPSIVLGHSVGEIAAACIAGAFSIETALEMAFQTTRLAHQLPGNNCTTASVQCSPTDAEAAISSLDENKQSRDMDADLRSVVGSCDMQHPLTIPLSSTVMGEVFQVGYVIDAEHWVKQLTAPVLFVNAFEEAMKQVSNSNTVVGVGPKPVLTKLAKALERSDKKPLEWIFSLDQGAPVNLHPHEASSGILDSVFPNRSFLPWGTRPHPLLQECSPQSTSAEFQTIFHDKLVEFFGDHMILDQTIFPCVSYVEMGLAAGLLTGSRDTMVELVGVKFVQQYTISAGLKMMSTHNFGSGMQFVELSLESNNESVVCSISEINKNQVRTTPTESLHKIKTRHIQEVKLAKGCCYNRAFQTIQSVRLADDRMSALAQIGLPADSSHEYDAHYHMHPALLDGATFQLFSFLSNFDGEIWSPAGISRVVLHRSGIPVWAHLVLVEDGMEIKSCRVELFDVNGLTLLSFDGVHCVPSDRVTPETIFVALGENYNDTAEVDATHYAAHRVQKYLGDSHSLIDYPWLENVLHHSHHDAPTKEHLLNKQLYEDSLLYRITVDLYEDLPKLLSDPLRMISLHPEHDAMYDSNGMSSSNEELASLLRLACNEWHGTKLRVFEVGTGSGGLTRRALPLIEDSLESYTCSDIFDIRLGWVSSNPLISTMRHDVNENIHSVDKYHLILAANAIHIAKNIKEALKRMRDALEEGGMLMLEELIGSDPLYLHGLDKFIWETANEERSCE